MKKRKPKSQATRKQISESLKNRYRYGSVQSQRKKISQDTLKGLKIGALVGAAEGIGASALNAYGNRAGLAKASPQEKRNLLKSYSNLVAGTTVNRAITGAGLGVASGYYRTGKKKLGLLLGAASLSGTPADNPIKTYQRAYVRRNNTPRQNKKRGSL